MQGFAPPVPPLGRQLSFGLPPPPNWEVLNGVGVDGFGVIFPFFFAQFSPFSSLFSASPKGQVQTTAICCKNGEFHSDPVCTDPVQNFPRQKGKKISRKMGTYAPPKPISNFSAALSYCQRVSKRSRKKPSRDFSRLLGGSHGRRPRRLFFPDCFCEIDVERTHHNRERKFSPKFF